MSDPIQSDSTDQPKPGNATLRARAAARLDLIAMEAKAALAQQGIGYPIFFFVPGSGDAIVVFGTEKDPPDAEWDIISNVLTTIIQETLGTGRLRGRELVCAATQSTVDSQEVTDENI
jgi:hypothetical protein